MPLSFKSKLKIVSLLIAFSILLIPNITLSQVTLKGKVIYEGDAAPAAAVNVEVMSQKGGTITNQAGYFIYHIKNIKNDDSLLITSVGYENLKIPLSAALKKSEFILTEKVNTLGSVTVFSKPQVVGSTSESVGYFRSWDYNHTGGEIGRVIKTPYKQYKIDKVRFKVANFCDTCQLRLHIRKYEDGQPGEEILTDSIGVTVNKIIQEGKVTEFDLTPFDLTFKDNELFVSVEILNCGFGNKKESCSFSFVGTEKGEYKYKSKANSDWQTTDDYTLYLKLFLRY